MPQCHLVKESVFLSSQIFFSPRGKIFRYCCCRVSYNSGNWNSVREACVVPTPWAFGKRNSVLLKNRKSSMLPSPFPATTYVFSSFYSLNVLNEIWYTYTKNHISMHEFLQSEIIHITTIYFPACEKLPCASSSHYRFLKSNHYLGFFPYRLGFPAFKIYITLYEWAYE